MNIIERLISAYPQDDVSHQDANFNYQLKTLKNSYD